MTAADYPISQFMTRSVHVVSMETSLSDARKLMTQKGIRHLPVLDGDRIVGLLSERELGKLEGFSMLDISLVSVPDAMADDPYLVTPQTPAVEVLTMMRDHRYGSAIVHEHGNVVGIFTTHDAVVAMVGLLT